MEQNDIDTIIFINEMKKMEIEKKERRREIRLVCALKTHSNILNDPEKYIDLLGKEGFLKIINNTIHILSNNEMYEMCAKLKEFLKFNV